MKRLLCLLIAVTLISCGDDDPTDPSDPFEQTITGDVAAGLLEMHSFTAPRAGAMTAVLTWDDGDIDLDLFLTEDECDDPYECDPLDESTAFFGTEETVQENVSSGQQLELWVDNWAEVDSDYTIEITID